MAIGALEFGLCSEEGNSEFLQLAIYTRFPTTFNIKVHVRFHKPTLSAWTCLRDWWIIQAASKRTLQWGSCLESCIQIIFFNVIVEFNTILAV